MWPTTFTVSGAPPFTATRKTAGEAACVVTLTAGVGGSLLSIGSAAGVALMGHAHGKYTFMSHLKWTWAVALGYALSIITHMVLNAAKF